ncbi:diguanylate cyclase [Desulfogranum japonicum]|uniref:diguanylate cyclase n=1 Tax=Desulfogranum japonicum TaxID=231447 RepID=UPI0004277B3D|nr:diguanylate cyclase [Desulfogranum japonicum]
MPEILIVDNSRTFSLLASQRMECELGLPVRTVHTFAKAKEIIERPDNNFFVALVGMYLDDADGGAIVDLMLEQGIPTIVFTGTYREDIREKFLAKNVVDYVLKEDLYSLDYISKLIGRLWRNRETKVLVVDDSWTIREHVTKLLKVQLFQVLTATDSEEALQRLAMNPDIKLVITDYDMPGDDGFRMVKKIRRRYGREQLAIIGLSSHNEKKLSVKFIKNGANDFITKPFLPEEFSCRIAQNLEMLDFLQKNIDSSNRDFLTGLYNRRFLFDAGQKLFENSKRKNISIAVVLIDIDHFKDVNDSYGHDIGDCVLKKVSSILMNWFRGSDIIARLGGEEFCIITTNMHKDFYLGIFDQLRETISNSTMYTGEHSFNISVSIGVCTDLKKSLEDMIQEADALLYKAKNEGRNRVIISS